VGGGVVAEKKGGKRRGKGALSSQGRGGDYSGCERQPDFESEEIKSEKKIGKNLSLKGSRGRRGMMAAIICPLKAKVKG